MALLVRFTGMDGKLVTVNVEHVLWMSESVYHDKPVTGLHFSNDHALTVFGTLNDTEKAIADAQRRSLLQPASGGSSGVI